MLPFAFTSPLMLLALAVLPALWVLLRLVPPRPARVDFPPLKLLLDLTPTEETPARTPWWLTLLRLLLAALAILMLAGPVLNPGPVRSAGEGPLLLMVDNGWAAARDWDIRLRAIEDRLREAEAIGRPVALLATAEPVGDLSLSPATAVRTRLRALVPQPWSPDRAAHLPSLAGFLRANPGAGLVWFSDGITPDGKDAFVSRLTDLAGAGRVEVVQDLSRGPLALAGAENAPGALTVRVLRALSGTPLAGSVRALDLKGLPLGDVPFVFEPAQRETVARLDVPVDLRNDVARLEIAGEAAAGAVQLLDDRWKRRTVGIASGQTTETAQPLLSAAYYLSQAFAPFADVRASEGASPAEAIRGFIEQKLPMIVLADVGTLGDAQEGLVRWIEGGGVLVRFAGGRLAASSDTLVPVALRRGDRTLGGALSWETPQALGSFSQTGPFSGMAVPADVMVTRQVLAEPDPNLPDRVWASLADGTPLVTAAKRGRGMIVLFHVTADATWSNLPLSGTFVEMLRRITVLSGEAATPAAGKGAAEAVLLAPARTLDGRGAFGAPPSTAEPLRADASEIGSRRHPPGFYGPADGLVAVNALAKDAALVPLDYGTLAASIGGFDLVEPVDLRPWLLVAGLALLLIDAVIVIVLAGGLARIRRIAVPVVLLGAGLLVALASPQEARAEAPAYEATLKTHLAYVVTGDAETDRASEAGLAGLTAFIAARTSLEPGAPIGLDLEKDELAFETLIYWPIVAGQTPPPANVMAKVDSFMKSGGTIIFDTRDALQQGVGLSSTPAGETLQKLLSTLDIPALEVVPRNHVLTKTFFLMETFPGRYENGATWVEAMPTDREEDRDRPALAGDGVSPIVITSNDLAAAWAVGPDLEPLYPLTPGGPRQRELAYRSGVNLVMYALTGNYKSDQVHVPALLERLGQ